MILVTGATGNIGRVLLEELYASGAGPVRGSPGITQPPLSPRALRSRRVIWREPRSLKSALDGVRSLFLVSRVGDDAGVLDAAREAGVGHVVLVSSITVETHPHLEPAQENRAVERLLQGSGMDWTVLRPTQFASNALWWAPSIRAHEPVRVPYADVGLPAVHPADIAAVARVALTEPGRHRGRTYALTGPTPITPRQQVDAIGAVLDRDVPFAEVGREEAHRQLAAVFGAVAADAVLDITGGDVNDALLRVRDTVTRVTRAPARTFHDWVAENARAFR